MGLFYFYFKDTKKEGEKDENSKFNKFHQGYSERNCRT